MTGCHFVSKFGPKFLNDASMDAMFDLLKDEVRMTVVKVIPDMCVDSPQLSTKIADVLGQLLLAEDPTELSLVKNSLILVIKKYPKEAMSGLFSQVMGEDDMTREKCIEFVCNSIMKHKNELFTKNFETEQFFIKQERGAPLDPFISFVCHKVFPILPVMEAKDSIDDILQLYAQSFLCSVTVELAKSVIELLFDMLLIHKVVHAITGDINSLVKQETSTNLMTQLLHQLQREKSLPSDSALQQMPQQQESINHGLYMNHQKAVTVTS